MSARHEDIQTCPACGRDKMHVNTVKGVFHCKRCGESGRVQKLGIMPTPALPLFQVDESINHTTRPDHNGLTTYAQNYLIQNRDIGWWLVSGLPIYSSRGGILFVFPDWDYWQVRQWSTQPRWVDPTDATAHARDGVTYNLSVNHSGRVVLVEGIGDALKVATAGYNASALLSSTLHDAQAEALSRTYSRATVMLDADVPVGRVARAMSLASEHFETVDLAFLTNGDPGNRDVQTLRTILHD